MPAPSLDYFAATVRARDSAIDAVQDAANAATESVCAELSRRWPRRLVTLWTGNGDSHITVSTTSIYGRAARWHFAIGSEPELQSAPYVTEYNGGYTMCPDIRLPVDLDSILIAVEAESIQTGALIGGSEPRMIWRNGKRLIECPHDWATETRLVNGGMQSKTRCRLCGESRA